MRVLLRHCKTGQFFVSPQTWTAHRTEATDFGQMNEAVLLAYALHLENVEIVLAFRDPRYDLRFPLHSSTLVA